MKNYLLKELYILMSASIFLCSAVQAQIIYTDVKPDETFSDSGSVYHLDLNNDGTKDFDISILSNQINFSGHCNGEYTNYAINITAQQSNAVLTDANYYPYALNLNNVIQPGSSYWSNAYIRSLRNINWLCQAPQAGCHICIWHLGQTSQGYWTSTTDEYLGLKLIKGNYTYYGWVRLSVYFYVTLSNQDSVSFTIKDYAFNSTPNMPILAGQKTTYNWIAVTALSSTNSSYPFQYCPKDKLSITYLKFGTFNSGNVFKVQLSDSTGSFTHPKIIGSIHSTNDTTIAATIPANTSPGGKYRVRIVSSNPVTDSLYDNGTDLVLGAGIYATAATEYCQGAYSNLYLIAPAGYSYKWHKNGKLIPGENEASLQILTDSAGVFKYTCIVGGICGTDASNAIIVTIHSLPRANLIASGPTTFCKGGSVTLTDTSTDSGLQYSWLKTYYDSTGVEIYDTIHGAAQSYYTATETGVYYIMVTNEHKCTSYSNAVSVSVPDIPKASIYIDGNNGDTSFCAGDSIPLLINVTYGYGDGYVPFQYQWRKNGKNISGATLNYYYAKTAGTFTCKVSNMCGSKTTKGVTVTTKQCLGLANNVVTNDEKIISKSYQLKVAPNPLSNSTTISFSLSQSQKVFLTIYDMNGRLVKVLANEQMQQGTHQLTWNARDEKGSSVVAGIYILKMLAGSYVETKKISVVK